jgi:hypothetical protein
VASSALKVYTLDKDGFFGKAIHFGAMAELAQRTPAVAGADENLETTIGPGRSRIGKSPHNVDDPAPAFQSPRELETYVTEEQQERII